MVAQAMKYTVEQFRKRISDQAWLDQVMLARHGGSEFTCPSCRRTRKFKSSAAQRAFRCQSCGHAVPACPNSPFENPRRPLPDWLYALHVMRGTRGEASAKDLQEALGCTYKTAFRMEQDLRPFASGANGEALVWMQAAERCLAGEQASGDGTKAPIGKASSGGASDQPVVPDPAALKRPRVSARAKSHALIFGGLIVSTASAIAIASFLTDRSGRIDGVETAQLAAPPSLAVAVVRSSIRLSPMPEDAVAEEAEAEYAENRESYDSIIREGTAPGPRDPNEVLVFGPIKVRRHIVDTIVKAARETKADPALLMAIADKESSFATAVQAKTSSATGLFQFIEKTWLKVVKDFGAKHGLEKEAKAIDWEDDKLVVKSVAEKQRILDLRRDPYLSALLAAEMLNRDKARIARRIGRQLTSGETYLAHFLGPDGAERFMAKMVSEPKSIAADLLPAPAKANKPIFYAQEKGLSMAEVHQKFEAMMDTRLNRYRHVDRLTRVIAYAPQQEETLVLRMGPRSP